MGADYVTNWDAPDHEATVDLFFISILLLFCQIPSIMAHLETKSGWLSKGNHSSRLENLPHELLQHIAHQLPLSSAASLALCSKSICYVVGLQYWHGLSSHTLEKAKFLEIIEKDHPGHWLCYVCTVLHPRPHHILDYNGNAYYEGTHRNLPKCIQACGAFGGVFGGGIDSPYLNAWYPQCLPILAITHPMIHVAMNRHLFGPSHGDSLDVFFRPLQKDVINKINVSTRACIIANNFYLRWQFRFVVPPSESFDYVCKVTFGVHICPHLRTSSTHKDTISLISKCMLSHRDSGPCEKCKRPIQCHFCLTEFQVSIHNLESIGHVLEYTVWKNFGSGRSPKDPEWANHVWHTEKNRFYQYLGVRFEFSRGIISSAFESEQSLETTCHVQPSPPQNNFPVIESHQNITNLPQILLENDQSVVGSYKPMTSQPKPPHRSFCHLFIDFAIFTARKLARSWQVVAGSWRVSGSWFS